jgi:serine/threonine protein kinase
MGTVWLACDELLQRNVAVKHVAIPALDAADRPPVRERVIREARAAARLGHPATVTVFDVVEEDGNVYIVMELVDAETLSDVVARQGPLPVEEAARIGLELVGALDAAHRQGIVHRDVKPSNVMLPAAGVVKLADFGIASVKDHPSLTGTGQVLGSPSYMAPEQALTTTSGEEVDWWALGATVYFAVEGRPPFERDGALATLTAVVHDPPAPAERAGPLTEVLIRLLDKEPANRPGPSELRRILRHVAGVDGPGPVPADPDDTQPPTAISPPAPEPRTPTEPTAPWPPPTDTGDKVDARDTVDAGDTAAQPPIDHDVGATAEPEVPGPGFPATDLEAARPAPPLVPPATSLPAPAPVAPAEPVPGPSAAPKPGGAPGRPWPPGVLAAIAIGILLVIGLAWAVAAGGDDPAANGSPDQAAQAEGEEGGDDVPADWVTYTDREVGYRVAHPPGWQVRSRGGTRTDIVDPDTGSYLRLDWTATPGPSPEAAWESQSKSFGARHDDYQEVRIEPTTFKGFDAAEWEFTYTDGGARLHAIDLGFVTDTHGFALNFQTHERRWDDSQDVFDAFKASFYVPD